MTRKAKAFVNTKESRPSERKYRDFSEIETLVAPLMRQMALPADSALLFDLASVLKGKKEAFFHYLVKRIEKFDANEQLNLLHLARHLSPEEHIHTLSELVLSSKTRLNFQVELIELIQSFDAEAFRTERIALEKLSQTLDAIDIGMAQPEIAAGEIEDLPKEFIVKVLPILAWEGHRAIALLSAFTDLDINDPDYLASIVETLARIAHPESVHLLESILGHTENKFVLKAIKRSLYHLKTKGLEVGEAPPTTAGIPRPKFKIASAWASHIDHFGRRLLFCTKTKPFGGFYLTYMISKEIPGIESCWVMEVQKRDFQSFYQRVMHEHLCIEISPEHFLFLFHEAISRMNSRNEPISEDVYKAKEILGDFDITSFQHPVYNKIDRTKVAGERWLFDRSAKLLEHKECIGWFFPAETVRKYYDEIKTLDDRKIIVSPQFKQTETNAISARALQELIDPVMQDILIRRLEETAYLLLKSDAMLEAKMAIAAAIGLEKGPFENHPLLKGMLTHSFEAIEELEKGEPGQAEERGNIIRL